ncbi:DUF885 domain-containing protein [Rhodothermus marinus]|uniref:DUF885 domain-containing protein n=1 Tax=Rhodothermus marinus TaxID=29549 RepID=UPI0006D28F96|nr:DUF885 domain-containing protein [Rhodothermus marinus]
MRTLRWSGLLLLAGLLSACRPVSDPAAQFRALLDESWAFLLRENPLMATYVGVHTYDDRLPSVTAADLARRDSFWAQVEQRLDAIDSTQLPENDRITYDIFRHWLTHQRAVYRYRGYLIPITSDEGFHIALGRLPEWLVLRTEADYRNYLTRLKAVPTYMAQHIASMREGLRQGITQPKVVLQNYTATITGYIVENPAQSVFFQPFREFPPGIPDSVQQQLRAEARRVIREQVIPAYRDFLQFMETKYIPGARTTMALSDLPDGRAYYEHLVRYYTTLELTPEEVHELGQREVARIRAEMDSVMRRTGFRGSFQEFLQFLRTDPRFYARSADELLREAAWIAKQMDGRLPALFHVRTLPRQPYGVAPVPPHLQPRYTGGRYIPAPPESRTGAYYWVNPYPLNGRPLYVLEALTLHEAVPGHHLQYAIRQELTDVHPFRRWISFSAFGEGWALYAEKLGKEVGFYADPYREFGRLTYEMWRACRLVVDTGLHALGWTRRQAIDYMAANTALSLHEITTEVDRYISWPGQALAYKMGELTILRLRREAETRLGDRFDLRDFHEVVLRQGDVPLGTLERLVHAYIEQKAE